MDETHDICTHFIHDSVNKWLVNVYHIPSTKNPADLLTKPLHCTIYNKWLLHISMHQDLPDNILNAIPSRCRSRGGVLGPNPSPPLWAYCFLINHVTSLLFPFQLCHCIPSFSLKSIAYFRSDSQPICTCRDSI